MPGPWIRLLAVLALSVCPLFAAAQEGEPASPPPLTAESIEARIAEIQETEGLEEADREAALEALRRAADLIAAQGKWQSRAEAARREAAEAPATLETVQAELAAPAKPVPPDPPADAPLGQLEQEQAQAVAALQAARDQLAELRGEPIRRQERRNEIAQRIPEIRQRLAELEQVGADAAAPVPGPLLEAQRIFRRAQQRALSAELEALEAEVAMFEARRGLLAARQTLADRRVAAAEQVLARWQQILTDRRQLEARRAAEQTEQLRSRIEQPSLQAFAAETQRLAELRASPQGVPQKLSEAREEIEEARTGLATLRRNYTYIKGRISETGLNRATGLLLRREYEALPDVEEMKRRLRATRAAIEDAEYELIERYDALVSLRDIQASTQDLLAGIGETGNEIERAQLEQLARDLVEARFELADDLFGESQAYFNRLIELDAVLSNYLAVSSAYEDFISERILWVRSIPGDRLPDAREFRRALAMIADGPAWRTAAERAWDAAKGRWPLDGLIIVALLTGFVVMRWCRLERRRLADLVGSYRTDRFSHTLFALLLTVIIALPVPALVWWAGWLLASPVDQLSLAAAAGLGLQRAAYTLFLLLVLRATLHPDGLAVAHFRWPKPITRSLSRHLNWFIPIGVTALAAVSAIRTLGDEDVVATFGRIAFSVGMIAVAVYAQRNLRRSVWPSGADDEQNLWLDRLRPLWSTAIVLIPVSLAVLAWYGFYYSATQLSVRLQLTATLIGLLVLLNALLTRWLFIARRRVAVEDARRRREQAVAAAQAKQSDEVVEEPKPTESAPPPVDEDKVDLPAISLQARQLFRMSSAVLIVLGLFSIWSGVLPALRMLDRVQVWPEIRVEDLDDQSVEILETTAVVADGAELPATGEAGEAAAAPTTRQPSVTLPGMPANASGAAPTDGVELEITIADIGMGIILLIITYVAFRNLPGLIEMIVLQRLPLDAASRYALSTVIRYSIALIGISTALGVMGVAWSRIQWLAAALTFGLAFGLQEIFANFISGLIILAERPIRIGDTVTVNNISGSVTKIRMRATTITDWDRKELIIPNKSFITGEVVNWTLSDPTLRLIIPVGVSYGADIEKVEKTLLEVAQSTPNVLQEPKAYVLFGRFGDSTLDFELRCFIPHIDHIIAVRHGLHKAIIAAFRREGIEIAFPQRDLHVRSADALTEALRQATPRRMLEPAEEGR